MLDTTTPQEQIGLTDSSENNDDSARVVKLLLNWKVDLAYKRNRDLWSLLHIAAYYGPTKAMVELLKQCLTWRRWWTANAGTPSTSSSLAAL